MTYNVDINFVNKKSWKFSMWIFTIALLMFGLQWIIFYPLEFIPDVLQVHYYIDVLPNWTPYLIVGSNVLLLTGYFFADIRHNKPAQLKITDDSIIVASTKKTNKIDPTKLLRIWVVHKKNKKKPFRIEFIYTDFKFIRVAFANEDRFFEAFEQIRKICPKELEITESTMESILTTTS